MIQQIKDFFETSTIHGIGKVFNENISKTERIAWASIITTFLIIAGSMLKSSFEGIKKSLMQK